MEEIDINNVPHVEEEQEVKRITYEQSGGFIEVLYFLLMPFIFILKLVKDFFLTFKDAVFGYYFVPVFKRNGSWTLGNPDGQGLIWKYIWWCLKTSFYLVIFSLGGIGVTFVGMFMVYKKLFKKFRVSTKDDDDLPESEKKKIEQEEMAQLEEASLDSD